MSALALSANESAAAKRHGSARAGSYASAMRSQCATSCASAASCRVTTRVALPAARSAAVSPTQATQRRPAAVARVALAPTTASDSPPVSGSWRRSEWPTSTQVTPKSTSSSAVVCAVCTPSEREHAQRALRAASLPAHLAGVRAAGPAVAVLRSEVHAPRGAPQALLQRVRVQEGGRDDDLCANERVAVTPFVVPQNDSGLCVQQCHHTHRTPRPEATPCGPEHG